MKKNTVRWWIVLAVMLVVYHVVILAVPFAKTGVFFLSWFFTLVAIGTQIYVIRTAFYQGESTKSKFYGWPIARIGAAYLVVQIVLSKELESMKAAQARQQKEGAYRALLERAGISEKRIATVVKASAAEIDALELDGSGGAVGADQLMDSIKSEWADFIPVTRTEGAPTPNPPTYGYTPSADDKIADAFKPKI